MYIGGDESASPRLYHKGIGTELIMNFYKPVISYRAWNKHAAASIILQHPPKMGAWGIPLCTLTMGMMTAAHQTTTQLSEKYN